MNILIIGGTRYIGRYLIKYLQENGHKLTLFHRGKTNVNLFPEIPRILGDRNSDLDNLGDRNWDVVIDTCGYEPKQVQASVDYLRDKVDTYVYISSIDAFEPTSQQGLVEGDSTQDDDFSSDKCQWWKTQYGRNKALCEDIVSNEFGEDHSLIIRPGMVIGPHDPILFFPYWVVRFQQGGDILAPGDPDQPLQYIDVRDLTKFIAKMVTEQESGLFVVTGPHPSTSLGSFLKTLQSTIDMQTQLHWVSTEFLFEQDLTAEKDIPYWLPGDEIQGYCNLDPSKSIAHGLTYRPLVHTIRDTATWIANHNAENPEKKITSEYIHEVRGSLQRSRELELLKQFQE